MTEDAMRKIIGGPKWFQDIGINTFNKGIALAKKHGIERSENLENFLFADVVNMMSRPAIDPFSEGKSYVPASE